MAKRKCSPQRGVDDAGRIVSQRDRRRPERPVLFGSFEPEWVEKNTALSRSKARALIQIYDSVVASGVKWAKVKHLGWTKLNAIARLLKGANADDSTRWLQFTAGLKSIGWYKSN